MIRVARTAKYLVYVGLGLIVLLLLYVLNSDEGRFNPEIRENVLSDYDFYMDEYNDASDPKDIDEVVVAEAGKGKEDDEDYEIADKDKDSILNNDGLRSQIEKVKELVVVVVSKEGDESKKEADKEEKSPQVLDTPNEVSENDDVDVLRGNDEIVDNVIVDRSEERLAEMENGTLSENDSDGILGVLQTEASEGSSIAFYKPLELLPIFRKPPADRDAPGEFGHPFTIPSRMGASVEGQIEEGYKRHAFNVLISDIISVHRNLGDKREDECKNKKFRRPLPSVSVIICFRNEALSTLLRTLYSVMETVPALLLKEIILVDDESHLDLHESVQSEIEDLAQVTMIRNSVQMGITQARMLGVKLATADVVTFLDSHCECYEGWMEPLLQSIQQNSKVVALPIMDIINPDTFKFSVTPMQRVQRGGFDWTLTYRWIPPPRERFQNPLMDMTKSVATPTMSGGVFAISKKYFLDLGNYDEEMKIWGAENLEMSFRVWMCGGRIEILPCSHVGHVFKSRSTNDVSVQTVLRNKRRVAEVWLDNYKALFYKRTPQALKISGGNTTSRLKLREELKCKSFKWYIENIYPELYVPELKPRYSGALCCRFGEAVDVCLDTHTDDTVPGRPLSVDKYQPGLSTQYFEFTKQNEIRQIGVRDLCMASKNSKLELQKCKFPVENSKDAPPKQQWVINRQDTVMTVVNRENDLCLTASTGKVWLEKCNPAFVRQKWRWQ